MVNSKAPILRAATEFGRKIKLNYLFKSLTMSAELMKSQIVCRPSYVCVAIISEPNARISFKFWLLLPLGHMLGPFLIKKNNIFIFYFFYEYFSFSLTWDPVHAKISKCYSSYKS